MKPSFWEDGFLLLRLSLSIIYSSKLHVRALPFPVFPLWDSLLAWGYTDCSAGSGATPIEMASRLSILPYDVLRLIWLPVDLLYDHFMIQSLSCQGRFLSRGKRRPLLSFLATADCPLYCGRRRLRLQEIYFITKVMSHLDDWCLEGTYPVKSKSFPWMLLLNKK